MACLPTCAHDVRNVFEMERRKFQNFPARFNLTIIRHVPIFRGMCVLLKIPFLNGVIVLRSFRI